MQTPRTDAAYDAEKGTDGPDRIDRMLKTSEELERERNRLFLAVTDAIERFDKICWGWDGDCGAGNIMRDLEEVRDAICTSNPKAHVLRSNNVEPVVGTLNQKGET